MTATPQPTPPEWEPGQKPHELPPKVAEARLKRILDPEREQSPPPANPNNMPRKAWGPESMTEEKKAIQAAHHEMKLGLDPGESKILAEMSEERIKEWGSGFSDGTVWLNEEPPPVDPVLEGVFDSGDLVAVIAPSKCRKSFFSLQMGIALASGLDFIGFRVPKQRQVLIAQLEVKPAHYHRRLRFVSRGMVGGNGSKPNLADRLKIFNGRGENFTLSDLGKVIRQQKIEVLILDPIYLLLDDENGAGDVKPLFRELFQICKDTGAAVVYVHHDGKGDASSRNTRDRGSGSGVIGRAYDACLTLTEHEADGHSVVNLLLRNYAPKDPFSVVWEAGAFKRSAKAAITRRNNPNQKPTTAKPDESFFQDLSDLIAEHGPMNAGELDDLLKSEVGLTKTKAADVRKSAVRSGVIVEETEFGNGKTYRLEVGAGGPEE